LNAYKVITERKASQFSALNVTHDRGRAIWPPANYESLALSGYQKNVIVHRAVSLIARSIGSVPWVLYHKGQVIHTHPLLRLLQHPNPLQGKNSFLEAVVSHLLLSGNSYIEATSPEGSPPLELYSLRPDRMRVVPGKSGFPEAYEYQVRGHKKRNPVDPVQGSSNILHLKLFNPTNDWYGLSPLEAARQSVECHATIMDHNISLLSNGGRPSGALMINSEGGRMSMEERENLRTQIKELFQGPRAAGQVVVLEGDFQWKEMGMSPKDMDFSEGRNLAAREIAEIFGVPPMLVGVPGDATFSNYREARLNLWEETILPFLEYITNQLNVWLAPLFGSDLRLSYDSDEIPPLAAKRHARWEHINKCDFLTLNEKRQAVGYPPHKDGDRLL
jgi:HK97 family phage portal protein